jgi:hypothetical protein
MSDQPVHRLHLVRDNSERETASAPDASPREGETRFTRNKNNRAVEMSCGT